MEFPTTLTRRINPVTFLVAAFLKYRSNDPVPQPFVSTKYGIQLTRFVIKACHLCPKLKHLRPRPGT